MQNTSDNSIPVRINKAHTSTHKHTRTHTHKVHPYTVVVARCIYSVLAGKDFFSPLLPGYELVGLLTGEVLLDPLTEEERCL